MSTKYLIEGDNVVLTEHPDPSGGGSTIVAGSAIATPVAWVGATDMVTNTNFDNGWAYATYIGKAPRTYTAETIKVVCDVLTPITNPNWAEIAVLTGTPVALGGPYLTRQGYLDVLSTFNNAGQYAVDVPVNNITVGDDVWIAFGSDDNDSNNYQIRGGLLYRTTAAFVQYAGQISTGSSPASWNVAYNTTRRPWFEVHW